MRRSAWWAAGVVAALFLFALPAWSQGSGNVVLLCKNATTGVQQQCNGSTDTGLSISSAGSTGTAYNSTTAATVPLSGYTLISTVPVTSTRNVIEAQNQSTDLVQLVLDDGAGNNQVSIMLAAALSSGGQGGGWSSVTFKGRMRIYAPNSADQVAAYQN
jgi:hypothetical protein